ncbi:hypothetical protein SAMN05877753_110194 [Bacillus oleivorans]|uniref:Uncharacterized protein n=1 Tax=Bacillus oleivorans TaxID=1448271 RepID=A0A285D593_9BACI|nr:hypothetical protein [Bacillus oleivorans]SNX74972.1 hypothetical protein SAMN05877753_110194 [Bacillus oleivorans]
MGDIQIGPFIMSSLMLSLLFSIFVAYIISGQSVKRDPLIKKQWQDAVFNSVFLFVLIYKGSIALFRPVLLFENPKALLFFNGGQKGMFLAIIVIVIYLYVKIKKEKWKIEKIYPAIVSGSLSFTISLFCCYLVLLL